MSSQNPTPQLERMLSLLQTGPRGLLLRFYDQILRMRTGAPVWGLSRIAEGVYIGGQHRPKGWKLMKDAGIEAVLNMREAHHDDTLTGIGGTYHLHLPTRDNTPPELDDLERAADFIAEHSGEGRGVYIHCGVGVGRAPSAAAAYLIKDGMSARDAIKHIRSCRPFVHLTPGQTRRLHEFEAMIRVRETGSET